MRKVGIITLNGYFNYGNRLQNYALQEVLKSQGFSVKTILVNNMNTNESGKNNFLIDRAKRIFGMTPLELFNKIRIRKINANRTKKFKKFTSKYILETDYCISDNNIPNDLSDRYDYFITGSDQVWNPLYINEAPIYFLTFTNKRKRIAYAPSFGKSDIPSECQDKFRNWISDMTHLSVREEAGRKIIKDLTGRDAIVLVDPTLMLSKEQWLSISKEALNKPKDGYILTYFLGGTSKENEMYIKAIAKQNNLKIVNMVDLKDEETYKTGPDEFINFINSASVFFTDSFHGVVFSILTQTPFVVYERISKSSSMYSRIETLLDMFDLRDREAINIKNKEQVFNMDFSHTYSILELERKKALDYLREALHVKDES